MSISAIDKAEGSRELPGAPTAAPVAVIRAAVGAVSEAVSVALLAVVIAALAGDLVVVALNVILRTFFGRSLHWLEEVSNLALVILAFFGGAVAYRRGEHPRIVLFKNLIPRRAEPYQQALVEWTVMGGCAWLAAASVPFLDLSWTGRTIVLGFSLGWLVLPLTIGVAAIGLFAFERLVALSPAAVLGGGAALAVVAVPAALTHGAWQDTLRGSPALWATLACFALLVLVSVPVPVIFAFCALLYVYMPSTQVTAAVPQVMQQGLTAFVLVSVPFFILAGFVMDRGGATKRIVAFLKTLLGHFRGGLLLVEIVAMYVFSGLSGSKTADVAAVGSAMTASLEDEGYDPAESAAVLSAAAAMGETIPPSIAMLILGAISTLSISALFLGGLLPAAILAITLMVGVIVRTRRSGFKPAPRATRGDVTRTCLHAVLPVMTLVILFGGIFGGFSTPTEASSFAVLYGLAVTMLVYRELRGRELVTLFVRTGSLVGMVLFMIATAGAFSWVLTVEQVPQRLANALTGLPGGAPVFIVVSIVALIAAGMIFEGLPALLVLAPIFIPVAADLHVNALTYGLVMIISMGIGAFAPPLGVGFFVACSVARASIERTTPRALAYFAILFVGLMIVAFVPWFTTIVPHLVLHKDF